MIFIKKNNPLKIFPLERETYYTVEGCKEVALKIYEKIK
jgi:hypothetical protein